MLTKVSLSKLKTLISYIFATDILYNRKTYSQDGEDLLIQTLFKTKRNGFYVDIGAHHPFRYSNTYLLYKSGWQGINIDANTQTKKLFDKLRPKDLNLETAVGKKSKRKFYTFSDPAFNTFSKSRMKEVLNSNQSVLKNTLAVNLFPLSEILEKYIRNTKIDLFNIDTEGMELEILKTNNWNKYKPYVIVIENDSSKSPELKRYLMNKGYNLFAHTGLNEIFKR